MNTILVNGLIIFFILILIFILSTIAGAMIVFLINEILHLFIKKKSTIIPYWISWLLGACASLIWLIFIYDFINSSN